MHAAADFRVRPAGSDMHGAGDISEVQSVRTSGERVNGSGAAEVLEV